MKSSLFFIPVFLILLSGCFQVNLPKQKILETKTYDLVYPEGKQTILPCRVEIIPFLSESPAKFKMMYQTGNQLKTDEYHKWVQTPSLMLTRFFQTAFPAGKSIHPIFEIRAVILQFSANDITKKADLKVRYSVSFQNTPQPFFVETIFSAVDMKNSSPETFAEAMSQAAFNQTIVIQNIIQNTLGKK